MLISAGWSRVIVSIQSVSYNITSGLYQEYFQGLLKSQQQKDLEIMLE